MQHHGCLLPGFLTHGDGGTWSERVPCCCPQPPAMLADRWGCAVKGRTPHLTVTGFRLLKNRKTKQNKKDSQNFRGKQLKVGKGSVGIPEPGACSRMSSSLLHLHVCPSWHCAAFGEAMGKLSTLKVMLVKARMGQYLCLHLRQQTQDTQSSQPEKSQI